MNGLQSLLNLIFPLITFPYISRVLSVNGVGKYNFSNSIVSYFLLIAALGISTFAVREGAKLRDNRQKINEFASKVFTINLVSTFVAYVLLFLTLIFVSNLHKYTAPILIFSIEIFFTTIGTEWVYIIFEEYGYITVRNIIFKIISLIMLFLFVRKSGDYLNYVAITVFASTGSYILNFFHAKKFCDLKINFNFNWKDYLLPILIMFATTVAIQIYVSSDITILGFLKNDYIVGIYSASSSIYSIVKGTLAAVTAVAIPRLAMLMGKHQMSDYRSLLKKLINATLVLFIPATFGLFMVSSDVIKIISGQKYLRATYSLRILCFGMIFSALSGIFNQCVLIPAKRERKTLVNNIISASLNIGLNFVLIPILDENGAALTTVLAEALMTFLNFYRGKDITGIIFKDGQIFKNLVESLISCSSIIFICWICGKLIGNVILKLIISVSLSVILYFMLLIFMKNEVVLSYIKRMKLHFAK